MPAMNVFCANCENECSEAARACPKCGHPLAATEAASDKAHETMTCPACEKSIIPQWTFLGREGMLMVGGVGIESYGKARLCPLCGIDVDRWPEERRKAAEKKAAQEVEAIRQARLTPGARLRESIIDRLQLLFIAAVILGFFLLLCL